MASMRKYALIYLDDDGNEQVDEVLAYSDAQAFYLAAEFCGEGNIMYLECSVTSACN